VSGKSPDGRYDDWSLFVEDLLAVVDTVGVTGWRGFGHSLGGAVLLLAETARPGTFASISCFEPVVLPDEMLSANNRPESPRLNEVARKRRRSFPSKQAAWKNYTSKPPFSRFDPEALEAYVEFGFVDEPSGSVTLACDPHDEASVYEGAAANGAWAALPSIRPPVAVLGGEQAGDPVGRIVEAIARRLPRGAALRIPGVDHFGPFEEPGKVADIAAEALGAPPGVPHGRPSP
jgi:pimeloyl-ACP methyl ester carboxylesterase